MGDGLSFNIADSGKHKYQSVVELIAQGITEGRWVAGERLPSNRDLARRFGVTVGTVSKAMSEAVRRGIVETRVGSGTYVSSTPLSVAAPSTRPPATDPSTRSVDLSLNVLPLSPVREILNSALTSLQSRNELEDLFAYREVRGEERFLRTAAHWMTAMGTPARPEQVLLTGGVHHGLVAAFQVLLQPGQSALCDALCYTGFHRIARLRGVRLVPVESDGGGMRPDSLERAVRGSGARVLVSNPVLQNPLACTQTPERRARIVDVCKRHDLLVIEDAVNVPLSDPGTPSLCAQMPERTLHLTGWSKVVASGVRLGYALVPAPWMEPFRDALVGAQWFAPGFFAGLIEWLQETDQLEACIEAQRQESRVRLQMLHEALPQAVSSEAGYHAWLPARPGRSGQEIAELAASAGIAVSAARHFAVDPAALGADGVRISLGHCEDRSQLQRGLAALASVMQAEERSRLAAPAV